MLAIKILKSRYVQALALALIAIFLLGQVASAAQCTMRFPNGTYCLVTYKPVAKLYNQAYAQSKVSCNKNNVKVKIAVTLQQKTPWGTWSTVNTDIKTRYNGYAVVDTEAGCRYGTSKSWRSITYVWANNTYGGSLKSPSSKIGCDI